MNSNEHKKIPGESGLEVIHVGEEILDFRTHDAVIEVEVTTLEVEADGELLEEVEVEVHVRLPTGRLPRAKRYIIRVDKQKLVTDQSQLTGRAILKLAGKEPPEKYKLTQLFRDGPPKSIGLDEEVDLCAPGVECFKTLKLEQTEGDSAHRRQFDLPAEDTKLLNAAGRGWETVSEGNTRWLLVHGFAPPAGYTVSATTIALEIPASYPMAQIDMAYFCPPLARADGRAIAALTSRTIGAQQFQRWSRHRTAGSQWRPDVDDVSTHLVFVEAWLEAELVKK
jgi:hypothetical protein